MLFRVLPHRGGRKIFLSRAGRRLGRGWKTNAGLGKPDEFRQLRKAHIATDLAVGVEQGFGGQVAELKAAAEALGGDGAGDVVGT
jgi:hypothetical protein